MAEDKEDGKKKQFVKHYSRKYRLNKAKRENCIRQEAYRLSQNNPCNSELDNWLQAEKLIDCVYPNHE